MIGLAVGPPVIAGAWLSCRQLIVDALVLLICEVLAAGMLVGVLCVVGLLWAIAKGAGRLARAGLRQGAVYLRAASGLRPFQGRGNLGSDSKRGASLRSAPG